MKNKYTFILNLIHFQSKYIKINKNSTDNRKTWARIPAQSKASFFPQKDFQIL